MHIQHAKREGSDKSFRKYFPVGNAEGVVAAERTNRSHCFCIEFFWRYNRNIFFERERFYRRGSERETAPFGRVWRSHDRAWHEAPLEKKIETIATRIYGAAGVTLLPAAATKLKRFAELGYGRLPVCMAKTQSSLSDDAKKLGRPRDFMVTIRDAKVAAGAGFVVAYAGDVLTMPGLPKAPAAEVIDLDEDGNVVGLF